MKRHILLLSFMFMISFALAADTCELDVAILNQDPIPAVPEEELEIVFVLTGIDSKVCGTIEFEVLEEFPFQVQEGFDKYYIIESGTFTKDFNSHKTIPIKFRVNKNALDGDNPLEVRYRDLDGSAFTSERFNISVEDVRADFEVFVSEYDYQTKEIKFEVLNIGENDIEAVTVEVVRDEGLEIEGSNRENIGDLSSNEDTSAEFKMDVNTDSIHLKIFYSDSINVRRMVEKDVEFDSYLFEFTKVTEQNNTWKWVVGVVIIAIIVFFFFRRRKKK